MNCFFLLSPLVLQTLIWPVTRPLFRFFLRLEIRGREHLDAITASDDVAIPSQVKQYLQVKHEKGQESNIAFAHGREQMLCEGTRKRGVIFVANHGSELDPILIPASLPFLSPLMPMFYTSRGSEFYKNSKWRKYFYGGLLFKLWGSHSLHSGSHDYALSLATHIYLLGEGKSLCMFPDGRKTSDADIGSIAHGGVGYLAWKTRATIVPVRIIGVHQTRLGDFLLRRRKVVVIFGELFSPPFSDRSVPPSADECRTVARSIMEAVKALA